MNLPDYLFEAPYGEVLLTGHRIGLYHVVQDYNDGYSPEMLAREYPTLPLELIHKVIAFYLENRAEVDIYIAEEQAEIDRQRASRTNGVDWKALEQKMRQTERSGQG